MLTRHPRARRTISAGLLLGSGLLAGSASAQLAAESLEPYPARIQGGTGRVRLIGMGGFETAVPDENAEINLFDFSSNPAGFSDDRDSWTIDLRYSHFEFEEGITSPASTDVKLNDGTFVLGYHVPKRHGLGGALDYSEAKTLDVASNTNTFNLTALSLVGNVYLLPRLSLGIGAGYASEDQEISTNEFYFIEHEAHRPHIGGGLALSPVGGITLGFRADAFPTTIDGTSASSSHRDSFTWDRPGTDWSLHAFIDRGRLEAGADYNRIEASGKESVRLSWSDRFPYNPTPEDILREEDTFSEDRNSDVFRVRGRLHVIPGKLSVSGAWGTSDGDFQVIANTNALGSLSEGTVSTSRTEILGGACYTMLQDRLLVAVEAKIRTSDSDRTTEVSKFRVERDNLVMRFGGEFLVGEKLAARLGVVGEGEDLTSFVFDESIELYVVDPSRTGSFDSWRLATGLGVVPWGAIWQLDLSYEATLDSGQGENFSHFAAYIRYLF